VTKCPDIMNIIEISMIETALPLKDPVTMSTGVISTAENLVVRIEDEGGYVGWGEAASAPSMTGETLAGMAAAALYLAPFLLSLKAQTVQNLRLDLQRRMPGNHAAKSALDMAIHDLRGRRVGKPIFELLGPTRRLHVETLALIGKGSLEQDVLAARRFKDSGQKAFKLKVGIHSVEEDVARALAVREALGPQVLLGADANGAWSAEQTDSFLKQTRDANLAFLEQPVADELLGELAALGARYSIPIGLDESLHSLADLRDAAANGTAQGGSLKLIKLGGLNEVVYAGQEADRLGCHVNLAGKVAESGISTAALLHVAAVIPTIAWGCSPTNIYLKEDILTQDLLALNGRIEIPQGPGLGVDVDENRLMQRAMKVHKVRV
jgi:muconate cycloisomerase